MDTENLKQIVRHMVQEAFVGNFAPMEAHPGMQDILPTVRYVLEHTNDHQVSFPLQFSDGEWVATIQRHAYVANERMFNTVEPGQSLRYEVLSFNRFKGNAIAQQHSQANIASILAQAQGDVSVESAPRQYIQTGKGSLPPDDACDLVRNLIEAGIAGNYAAFEGHSAFKDMIPEIERRRASSSLVQVSFPLQFSDGEWVASRTVWQQTAKGEMFGVDATGKELEFEVLMVHRIANGAVVDGRDFADMRTIQQQLGIASPEPQQ